MASNLLLRAYENDTRRARDALRAGEFDGALALLDRYKGLLSIDVEFMVLYATLVERKGDFARADAILVRALEIDPAHPHALVGRSSCLTGLGRRADALRMLEAACSANPGQTDLFGSYLTLLLVESGAAAAIAALRAEHSRRAPPRRLELAIEKLREKSLALYDIAELARLDPDDLLDIQSNDLFQAYSLRSIYERMEPIGCNCELGFVQRKSGAEPLSLLRWTAITPEQLIQLLSCDLEGYENPERYSLKGNFHHEFILSENVFGTKTHTGVSQSDLPPAEFLDRMTRRQGFLKRKFLADAAQGQKVFTYKSDLPLTDEQIDGMEFELYRLGVRHCLFVMPAPDLNSAGTVKFPSFKRGIGYISSVLPNPKYEEWNSIAVAVHDKFLR